jgi:hypothetical protein
MYRRSVRFFVVAVVVGERCLVVTLVGVSDLESVKSPQTVGEPEGRYALVAAAASEFGD